MPYMVIQPPFSLKFREMSKQELGAYGSWFRESLGERVAQLEGAVRATPGYNSWSATFTPESLVQLGKWFAGAVSTRPRAPEEMADLKLRGNAYISPPDVELTDRSFSLAMDIGMYLAKSLERAHPSLVWKQFLDDQKFADYGQPVLVGLGPVPLNPVRIAVTLAYGLASKKQKGDRLRALFDYWSNQVHRRKH